MPKPVHTLTGTDTHSLELRSLSYLWERAEQQLIVLVKSGRDSGIIRGKNVIRKQLAELAHLLAIFSGSSISADEVMADDRKLKAAVKSLRTWLDKKVYYFQASTERDISTAYRQYFALIEERELDLANALRWEQFHHKPAAIPWGRYPSGIEIHVRAGKGHNKRALLLFSWTNADGEACNLSKVFLPDGTQSLFDADARKIFFCAEHIEIRDGAGHILGRGRHQNITVTRDEMLAKLSEDPRKEDFIAFWDHQLETTKVNPSRSPTFDDSQKFTPRRPTDSHLRAKRVVQSDSDTVSSLDPSNTIGLRSGTSLGSVSPNTRATKSYKPLSKKASRNASPTKRSLRADPSAAQPSKLESGTNNIPSRFSSRKAAEPPSNVETAPITKTKLVPKAAHDGRPLIYNAGSVNEEIKTIKDSLPMRQADALWLLNEFLKAEYPHGGEVILASPVRFPAVDSVWTRLEKFCRTSKYRNHPYIDLMESWVELGKGVGEGRAKRAILSRQLTAAFNVLRKKVTSKQVFIRPQPDIKAKCTNVLTVSADVNPVVLGNDK
ncbi:hypothetical protein EDD37DRAFT_119060 [Exophiala viscosa]|uniref:uncharacterized protein n=1 Tax=Exophiala viscosa TaxID=2486360 RepID=UPI00219C35ED|nr:hypothetical protein EDD37DRAFT_119060 [Exophiala viscosa]